MKMELLDFENVDSARYLAVLGERHKVDKMVTIVTTMLASFPFAEGHENDID
jgi:hypothetical protein